MDHEPRLQQFKADLSNVSIDREDPTPDLSLAGTNVVEVKNARAKRPAPEKADFKFHKKGAGDLAIIVFLADMVKSFERAITGRLSVKTNEEFQTEQQILAEQTRKQRELEEELEEKEDDKEPGLRVQTP